MFRSLRQKMTCGKTRLPKRARRAKPGRARQRKVSLEIQALEDRCVPTVLFTPHFGPDILLPTENGNFNFAMMSSPRVYLIFWGTYWQGNKGQADTLTQDIQAILNSADPSALTVYGSDGKALYGGRYDDNMSAPPPGFNPDGWNDPSQRDIVQNEIAKAINTPGNEIFPPPASGDAIYTVITDAGNSASYNYKCFYTPPGGSPITTEMISLSFVPSEIGYIASVFSHELIEAMSDPYSATLDPSDNVGVTIQQPPGVTNNLDNAGQICDSEATVYGYRLGGPGGFFLAPYWDDPADRFVVPDGNRQQLTLQAAPGSWTTDNMGNDQFSGVYDLTIKGDQLGPNTNDALTISESGGGLFVTLNGESFYFDASSIANISVDLGGGTNSLTVDASADSQSENVAIGLDSFGNTRVAGLGPTIYYSNIATLQVNGGPQQNTFTVQDPGWGVAVTLNTGDGDQDHVNVEGTYFGPLTVNLGAGRDFVDICPASQDIGRILGTVTVHGAASADASLTVHDHFHGITDEYTLTAAGVAANADHGAIYYDGFDSVVIDGSKAGTIFDVLDTPAGTSTTLVTGDGQSAVTVERITGDLTVDFGQGTDTAQVCPTGQDLDSLLGALTVHGGGGTDTLALNDQANPNPSTWTATGGDVTRYYFTDAGGIPIPEIATVNYSGITNLVLNAGSGGNSITLSPTAQDLDELPHSASVLGFTGAGSVTVHGGGNDTLVLDDQNNPQASTWAVTAGSVTRSYTTVVGGLLPETITASVNYSGLASLTINGGTGGNTFNVESTAAGTATTVNAGAGNALVEVSPQAENLDNLQGPLTVHGNGSDALVVNDQNNPNNVLTQDFLTATSLARDGLSVDPVLGNFVPHDASIGFDGLSQVTLNAGGTACLVNVVSTAAGTPVTINSSISDAVLVGNSTDGVGDIQGAVNITNNAAAGDYTALLVDDSAYHSGYWISTLTTSSLTTDLRTDNGSQVSVAPINFVQSDLSSLGIHLGNSPGGSGNAVQVTNTPTSGYAGGLMTTITPGIAAGGVSDGIYVGATTGPLTANLIEDNWLHMGSFVELGGGSHTLDNIRGPVTVNTPNGGWTDVGLDDSGSTTGHTYTVTKTTIAFRPNLPVLTYHVNNEVFLNAGSGVNTINLKSTCAATAINAGLSGNDTINVGGPGNTLQGVINDYLAIQIDKPGSHVYLNDQGDSNTQPQTYTVGMLRPGVPEVVGAAGDTFFSGPLGGLTLNASNGNDTFAVQALWPSPTHLAIKGGTGTNTLVGPNITNNWLVSGTNSGSLDQTISFSAVQKMVGGTGVDVFKLAAAGKVASINGGGAPAGMGDWLDYSAWTTLVTVNLATGAATGVGGGAAGAVTNIQDVHGGNGGNMLTGDTQGNILIGGTGNDTITGGSGRSLLIGDKGTDHITGGSGGSASGGDILIGGYTIYDAMTSADETALMAIFAEWQSADSYATRFSKINTSSGIPGGYKLNFGTTVKDDGSANTLTGATSGSSTPPVDWFFADALDTLVNFETAEHKNNS
jgi:hypothetical protein